MKSKLIAFTGFAHSGKDEAAKVLIAHGYSRRCFGDIIKLHCDDDIKAKFKFSAFTEVPEEKAKIRHILEQWGETHYDEVFNEFFKDLPERCVNTRLCRLREATEWIKRGGVVIAVLRQGVNPETQWSGDRFNELKKAGVIFHYMLNDGTLEQLHEKVITEFELNGIPVPPQPPAPSTPKLASTVPKVSTVAARESTPQNSESAPSAPAHVAPLAEAPGNADLGPVGDIGPVGGVVGAPHDQDGFEEFVPEPKI